jgi:predicted transcriptional regulator
MDIATFFIALAQHAAWPVASVVIVFALRKEIRQLLPSIRKFKAGPLEVELEKVAEKLEETRKLASGADAKADLAVERLGEKEEEESEGSALLAGTPSVNQTIQSQVVVTPNQRLVLRALNNDKFVARTLTGIAKEAAISIRTAQLQLANLVEKGLVAKAHASDGRILWVLTPTGRAVANEA